MGLKADGIISGLNTSQIVSQLGQLYSRPQAFLKNKVSLLGQKKTAYTSMNSLLASVKSSLASINTTSSFRSNSVKTSDTAASYFSVTADGSALPGSYTVGVEKLAKSQMYTVTIALPIFPRVPFPKEYQVYPTPMTVQVKLEAPS